MIAHVKALDSKIHGSIFTHPLCNTLLIPLVVVTNSGTFSTSVLHMHLSFYISPSLPVSN